MKKYLFILLLLIINETSLQAQQAFSDSLRHALKNSPVVDSNYVKNLLTAILFLPYSQPDSALYYADYALKLSQQLEFNRGIAYSYRMMAECYIYTGDYSKSIFYVYRHLNLFTAMGDIDGINDAYGQLSEVYAELGDYRKALEYMVKRRENLIAAEYKQKNNFWLGPVGDPTPIWFYDQGLAFAYLNAQMVDSAFKYGERAFLAHKQWSIMPILMGDIFLMKNDYTTALKYYNTRTTDNYPVDSVKNFIGKAKAFKHIQQQDSSRIVALQALEIARRINYAKGILQASELLSIYYEKLDPYKSLEYLKISNAVRDSLYNKGRINQVNSIAFNDELRRLDAIAAEKAARDTYKIWSLFGIMFTLFVTGILLWRNNQHKKKANSLLQHQKEKVENTLAELKLTQSQLIQSEKMASLGELTAGIAHEIQNPLNFVNNFSEVNKDLLSEMKEEIKKGNLEDVKSLAENIIDNQEKINHHGKRADAIVKNMLQHSRSSSGVKEFTDINTLVDEYLRLAYHGFRAKNKSFNVTLNTSFDAGIGNVSIVPQDIGRVILNILNNAFYTVNEKKDKSLGEHEPTVSVSTKKLDSAVLISIKDNGNGIPQEVLGKIFQPFFTTKPTGQGTGLGLSLSYDIAKAHGGELRVVTEEGEGSEFMIHLPVS